MSIKSRLLTFAASVIKHAFNDAVIRSASFESIETMSDYCRRCRKDFTNDLLFAFKTSAWKGTNSLAFDDQS